MPPSPRAPASPPISSISQVTFSTRLISVASSLTLGSSVKSPSASVSSTSTSAPTSEATSAPSMSLSPKVISSVATVSFSLMTGTTPISKRVSRVCLAFRYCWRRVMSCCVSRTWPAVMPAAAKMSV